MPKKTRRARKPAVRKKRQVVKSRKMWKIGKTVVRSGLEYTVGKAIKERTGELRYEETKLDYIKPATHHVYTPDFELPNGIFIEVKGVLDLETRKKMVAIKESNPEADIRFVFGNANNRLRKGSPTTYAMWAETVGFKWAHKEVPEEWYEE